MRGCSRVRLGAIAALVCCLALSIVAPSAQAQAREKGDWLLRLRAINVLPIDDSSEVTGFEGSSVTVNDDTTAELDVTYMITDRVGLELIAANATHRIAGEGSLEGLGDIIETEVLPPTLVAQYHFDAGDRFMPYIGAGVNFTILWDEDARSSLEGALGDVDVDIDDSFGLAAQAGSDFRINDRWFANVDVKFIHLDTTADLNYVVEGEDTVSRVDVDIDPFIFGVGIGVRF